MSVLSEQVMALLRAAQESMQNSYAPYSEYQVGAAFLTESGAIVSGANVENASYGLSMCAERTAMFAAVAAGDRKFLMGAIVSSGPSLPLPCGACRQVMVEFCKPDMPLYVALEGQLDSAQSFTLGELMPHAFSLT